MMLSSRSINVGKAVEYRAVALSRCRAKRFNEGPKIGRHIDGENNLDCPLRTFSAENGLGKCNELRGQFRITGRIQHAARRDGNACVENAAVPRYYLQLTAQI